MTNLDSILKSRDQLRQHIKKQRHYFANKGPSSQGYGFSSSHVCMWELDYKESWDQKGKRHVYPNVHCSTVYNSQDMEAT